MRQRKIKKLFTYVNGNLIWNETRGRAKKGDIAGCLHHTGYITVRYKGKAYLAHRLIYIYHNQNIPDSLFIDHINGNRSDNLIDNLRLVNVQENGYNRKKVKGYSWDKAMQKWRAMIKINQKSISLGFFDTEDEARAAYLSAKKTLHVIKDR